MYMQTNAAQSYAQNQVYTRSPVELVSMLFEGAAKFLGQARSAALQHNTVAKREALSRTLAIVGELQNSLDLKAGGKIAENLDALYAFVTTRLIDANADDNIVAIDEVRRVLDPLRSAWSELESGAPTGQALETR